MKQENVDVWNKMEHNCFLVEVEEEDDYVERG
jgi:hypothetical protein